MSDYDPELEAQERERLAQIRTRVDAALAEIDALSVDRPRDMLIPAVLGAIFGVTITATGLFMLGML